MFCWQNYRFSLDRFSFFFGQSRSIRLNAIPLLAQLHSHAKIFLLLFCNFLNSVEFFLSITTLDSPPSLMELHIHTSFNRSLTIIIINYDEPRKKLCNMPETVQHIPRHTLFCTIKIILCFHIFFFFFFVCLYYYRHYLISSLLSSYVPLCYVYVKLVFPHLFSSN